jgi:hypothetical protein
MRRTNPGDSPEPGGEGQLQDAALMSAAITAAAKPSLSGVISKRTDERQIELARGIDELQVPQRSPLIPDDHGTPIPSSRFEVM